MASTPTPQLIPPPDEINDAHKVYSIAISIIVIGVVSSLLVLLRLWYRFRTRTLGPDDYAIIPALLFYLGWTAMAVHVNLNAGVGKPLWEITVSEYSVWFKGIIGSAWLYPAMTGLIRVSILLFYRRIFGKTVPKIKWIVWILLALQIVFIVVYSILPAFICKPLNKLWKPLERQKYMDDWYYYYTQVALYSTSMAFDIVLFFMPLYPVSKLQMPLKKRLGVSVLFMLGAAASIAAAYKLAIFVSEMKRYTRINPVWLQYEMSMRVPPQFDRYGITFWIPSQIEPSVALIGGSLPAIRVMFSKIWHKGSNFVTTIRSKQSGTTASSSGNWSSKSRSKNNSQLRRTSQSGGSNVGLREGYFELQENGSTIRSTY